MSAILLFRLELEKCFQKKLGAERKSNVSFVVTNLKNQRYKKMIEDAVAKHNNRPAEQVGEALMQELKRLGVISFFRNAKDLRSVTHEEALESK